jgi:hypothetical protein
MIFYLIGLIRGKPARTVAEMAHAAEKWPEKWFAANKGFSARETQR